LDEWVLQRTGFPLVFEPGTSQLTDGWFIN